MNNIVSVQIRSSQGSSSDFELKSLGLAIKKAIEVAGAKCLPIWADSTLTIAVEGVPPSTVEALLKPFIESIQKRHGILTIVQKDEAQLPEGGLPADFCQPGAILHQRLTRKFLFSLPVGAFVVSNIFPNGGSAFAEQIGAERSRTESWKRALATGAAQRYCHVLWTKEEFDKAAAGHF